MMRESISQHENKVTEVRDLPHLLTREADTRLDEKRKEFDLQDSRGEKICEAVIETSTIEGQEELRGFYLRDNAGELVNILSRINTASVPVFISPEQGNSFDPNTNTISIKQLDSLIGVSALFHEMGHAEQWSEDIYKDIIRTGYYGGGYAYHSVSPYNYIAKQVDALRALFPKQTRIIPDEVFQKLHKLASEAQERAAAYNPVALERLRRPSSTAQDSAPRVSDAEFKQLYRANEEAHEAFVAAAEPYQKELQDLFCLPERTIERNANYRGLRWLRKLKKDHGIDLLTPEGMGPNLECRFSSEIPTEKSVSIPQAYRDHIEMRGAKRMAGIYTEARALERARQRAEAAAGENEEAMRSKSDPQTPSDRPATWWKKILNFFQ